MNKQRYLKKSISVLVFTIPALILLFVFWVYPICRSVWISFTDWDYMTPYSGTESVGWGIRKINEKEVEYVIDKNLNTIQTVSFRVLSFCKGLYIKHNVPQELSLMFTVVVTDVKNNVRLQKQLGYSESVLSIGENYDTTTIGGVPGKIDSGIWKFNIYFSADYIRDYIKLYMSFWLSFYISLNVRKALFYRLYGHFAFVVNLAYLGLSSYIFPVNRG